MPSSSGSGQSAKTDTYNERLFDGGGIRSYLHNGRFHWTHKKLLELGHTPKRMVEIGCYDGRLLNYLPEKPDAYEGFDAGWGVGLENAQTRYAGHPSWRFTKALDASALKGFKGGSFDLAAAMETIEHVPPHLVDDYLEELARITDGYFLVTVPNEKGIVFLAKWLVKKFIMRSAQDYTLSELLHATLGNMDKVERDEHKGFDYAQLVNQISRHFEIVSVENIPFRMLPASLAFTVGIVARSRQRKT